MNHDVALGLLGLPVDILLYMLVYLDAYDLVRARKLCNTLRQLIDSSEELLYTIDLKYYHTIPSPLPVSVLPIAIRRKLLRQRESAWQKAEYSQRDRIPFPHPDRYHQWSCGVLGIIPRGEIKFIQFPLSAGDRAGTTMCRQWSYKIDNLTVHYSYSPMQDLLVLLTRLLPVENHEYEISFRSLSEDKFHPDAASAVVKMELLGPKYTEVMIFGDYYGLFCKNVGSNGARVDVLQVWNWKVKDWYRVKIFDPEDGTMHFRLILNDRLLVVNTIGDLTLYSLVNSSDAIQLIVTFSLPSLPSTSAFRCIMFARNQDHDYSSFNTPLCSSCFHGSARNQLIAITMIIEVERRLLHSCILYVEQDRLLELESTYTNLYGKGSRDPRALPWSAWGPGYARIFSNSQSLSGLSCCYGLRTAGLIGENFGRGELRLQQLCIRDFNPHRVRHYKTGDGTEWHERLVEGDPPNADLQSLFLESIGGLPYLEVTTQERFLADGIYMDESRVMLSLASPNSFTGWFHPLDYNLFAAVERDLRQQEMQQHLPEI
ncbi:hypothetical protein AZE42_02190 [Rhizopogon vesiculosus]|uniref:F-box domain-containing protein n=1 Tax=Rhizopogon vesiculosus TaxID=180088 RepID=A0A1J8PWF0_9AGAM|nr:hypothetical protein AZE42_02190 [Rhizopogon vesiculosus]